MSRTFSSKCWLVVLLLGGSCALGGCAQKQQSAEQFDLEERSATDVGQEHRNPEATSRTTAFSGNDEEVSVQDDGELAPMCSEVDQSTHGTASDRDTRRTSWTSRTDEPTDLHPRSKVFEPGHFDWAPERAEVVLHTYEESEATRSSWEHLVGALAPSSDRQERLLALRFEVGLDAKSDPELEPVREKLTSLKAGETIYFGIGGPFARHRLHLFECGPVASETNDDNRRHGWRVGDFIVECDFPKLRYGVGSKYLISREPLLCRREHVFRRSDGRPGRHCLFIPPEPSLPSPYARWWRTLRDALVGNWREYKFEMLEHPYWLRSRVFLHAAQSELGRSPTRRLHLEVSCRPGKARDAVVTPYSERCTTWCFFRNELVFEPVLHDSGE